MKNLIYLDYNASAPLRPEAKEAMMSIFNLENAALNASSVHHFGRQGRKIIEEARSKIAALTNSQASQVIFNSGATEGNNTVLQYFHQTQPNQRILVSTIEHPSVLEVVPTTEKIPVTKDGIVDLNTLEKQLSKNKVSLVSVMYANNETGIIQPIDEITKLAKRYGAYMHCDAVQAAGKIPIDMTGIDFLTISAHKIGGSQGIGALVLGVCGETPILLHGGGQEKKARAGTENIAAIAGFGTAAQLALQELPNYKTLETWRNNLEREILTISPELIIHGANTQRLPGTSFFSLPGASSETMLMALDLEGFAISNGSACSSGTVKPSNVLLAMGVSAEIASSALRVSIGWATKESDIHAFIAAWTKIYERLKAKR